MGCSPDHLVRTAERSPSLARAQDSVGIAVSRTSLFDGLISIPRTTNSHLNSNNLGNPFKRPLS